MTTILLVCIVMLFISRIKETPSMLSENRYYEKVREVIKSNQELLNNLTYDKRIFVENFAKFAVYPYSLFMCLIYASIGARVDSLAILFLSVMQIWTVMITMYLQRNVSYVSLYVDDFKFYRWHFLFNVILDYIYYPLTFVALLMGY
ncbi:hypothetical protein DS742_23750 [Lacrimispora amygdalina]|uniref:Uncharacterized protein n=1 Tax=Lacrimispora amygdalina TaxID=253257 RepID=A0A3E2N687_9FIRM|nr:hypothetical protein [Clostridium indicum]RFZ76411.1 hypothetical protein DS742_23750 [Clostridium indicum]